MSYPLLYTPNDVHSIVFAEISQSGIATILFTNTPVIWCQNCYFGGLYIHLLNYAGEKQTVKLFGLFLCTNHTVYILFEIILISP